MKPPQLKWLGALVVIVSIIFLFERLWAHREIILLWSPSNRVLLVISLGAFFYSFSCLLLSMAWGWLLQAFGCSIRPISYHSIYGRSQITKYLPGNIFHYVGRQVLGHQAGCPHAALLGATLLETVGLVFVSSLLGLTSAMYYESWWVTETLSQAMQFGPVILFMIIIGVVLSRLWHSKPKPRFIWTTLIGAGLLYTIYFASVGTILLELVIEITDTIPSIGRLVGGFALIWLIGFITPGAPGGIGVRELLLTLFLTPQVGEHFSLLIAGLFRVVTLLGDAVFFLVAIILERRRDRWQ